MNETATGTRNDTFAALAERALDGPFRARAIEVVQVNIGLECNLACRHCHVESSPARRERMSWRTMTGVLEAATRTGARTLDITGGAPEMHPDFRAFVSAARQRRLEVMVRTNLTVLLEPQYASLPDFFRDNRVHLVASLPCYLLENVDRQRGKGVFDGSVRALVMLNELGYGRSSALPLDLVYNPLGATLPPDQAQLEQAYREVLRGRHGIEFTRLYALANMAIGRFAHDLEKRGELERYREVLRAAFNPATVPQVMCRNQLHVGWDGTLYDCAFNFALQMPLAGSAPRHVRDLVPAALAERAIATGEHCFGCTAGHGSSCGGALA